MAFPLAPIPPADTRDNHALVFCDGLCLSEPNFISFDRPDSRFAYSLCLPSQLLDLELFPQPGDGSHSSESGSRYRGMDIRNEKKIIGWINGLEQKTAFNWITRLRPSFACSPKLTQDSLGYQFTNTGRKETYLIYLFIYVEKPIQILDRKEKVLRSHIIPLVKVLWQQHSKEEATWEREDEMKEKYPDWFESKDCNHYVKRCEKVKERAYPCPSSLHPITSIPHAANDHASFLPAGSGERNGARQLVPNILASKYPLIPLHEKQSSRKKEHPSDSLQVRTHGKEDLPLTRLNRRSRYATRPPCFRGDRASALIFWLATLLGSSSHSSPSKKTNFFESSVFPPYGVQWLDRTHVLSKSGEKGNKKLRCQKSPSLQQLHGKGKGCCDSTIAGVYTSQLLILIRSRLLEMKKERSPPEKQESQNSIDDSTFIKNSPSFPRTQQGFLVRERLKQAIEAQRFKLGLRLYCQIGLIHVTRDATNHRSERPDHLALIGCAHTTLSLELLSDWLCFRAYSTSSGRIGTSPPLVIGPVLLLSLRVLLHTGPLEFLLESYTPDFEGNSLLQLVLRRDENTGLSHWQARLSPWQGTHSPSLRLSDELHLEFSLGDRCTPFFLSMLREPHDPSFRHEFSMIRLISKYVSLPYPLLSPPSLRPPKKPTLFRILSRLIREEIRKKLPTSRIEVLSLGRLVTIDFPERIRLGRLGWGVTWAEERLGSLCFRTLVRGKEIADATSTRCSYFPIQKSRLRRDRSLRITKTNIDS
uniref:Chromo domain-containing protein n=1 Tax=Ananas comosus var. bracteatus TaxID=296719 RepID=A0A6V7PYU8_ANACO|nr:unnamed protein product [Ananas comosus var. bracteatus]